MASLHAFDYKVSGKAESFSKFGFNNTPINSIKGKYPTESFVTMVGALQIDMNLLPQSLTSQTLKTGIGGLVGGLAFDSGRNLIDHATGAPFGSPIFNYFGYYAQYEGNAPWQTPNYNIGMSKNSRDYVIYNAYLDYDYAGIFGIKGGRYESGADFYSGFTQGFEVYTKFSEFKLWWFSSYGRAFAYDEWLYDFYAPKTYTTPKGKTINLGIHAFKATWAHHGVTIAPFIYFSPKTYTAPSIEVGYDSNPEFDGKEGFRSQTTVIALFVSHDKRVRNVNRYGNPAGTGGQTLLIKQRFDIDNYNIGGGIYKNFGNANAEVGTYGNPMGIDFWTASVYDIGASVSDMIGEDALSGWIYGGGVHGDFMWGVLGRLTTSKRSNEQSIAINVAYNFPFNISAGLKLEYFNDITKTGYKVGDTGRVPGQPQDISDRSHMMAFIRHSF
ncbi:hypothetical protein BKH45_03260 [Helicobacter sp. 11S03491-1]|nr:hypothetical protein BKH45_03260 [Helicobacter sp. 11S03491-1]